MPINRDAEDVRDSLRTQAVLTVISKKLEDRVLVEAKTAAREAYADFRSQVWGAIAVLLRTQPTGYPSASASEKLTLQDAFDQVLNQGTNEWPPDRVVAYYVEKLSAEAFERLFTPPEPASKKGGKRAD